jgi:hypothetical protein
MKLWISGEVHVDVAEGHAAARKAVARAFNTALGTVSYGVGIEQWAFIPIILPEGWNGGMYPEIHRYHRRRKSFEFRLAIPFSSFKAADSRGQASLLCGALLRSLELMETMRISEVNVKQLRQAFRGLAASNGWLTK